MDIPETLRKKKDSGETRCAERGETREKKERKGETMLSMTVPGAIDSGCTRCVGSTMSSFSPLANSVSKILWWRRSAWKPAGTSCPYSWQIVSACVVACSDSRCHTMDRGKHGRGEEGWWGRGGAFRRERES